ncbi:MAG: MFS transporter [Clostridiales bacterium]|jgi:MFS family permease|nr:MFS transporter [Clostridiales bacterium]
MSQNKISFILLVISQGISLIGAALLRFAISLHVLDLTGSAEIFATIVAVSFLPMVFFTPIGGAIADRFSKKVLLVISDGANTLFVGILAALLFGGSQSVVLLGATITLLTLVSAAYHPTVTACLPVLVEKDELVKANGIIKGIRSISILAAPMMAGVLFGAIGVENLVGLCVVIFFFSAVINIFIKIPYAPKEMKGGIIRVIAADLKEGFIHITKENPLLFKLSLIFTVLVFFFQAMLSVAFPYTIRIGFGMSEQIMGLANASIGAAVLMGSLVAGRLKNYLKINRLHYFIMAIGIASAPIAVSTLLPTTAAALPLSIFVLSFMLILFIFTLIDIAVMTYAQTNVPPHLVGKAVAIFISIANLSAPVGQLVLGLLIENLGEGQFALYLAIAALTVLLGIIAKKRLAIV